MSYVFDEAERAWGLLRPHVPKDLERVAIRFELLLDELHEANHRLKDAVNHDPRVRTLAAALEDEVLHFAQRRAETVSRDQGGPNP